MECTTAQGVSYLPFRALAVETSRFCPPPSLWERARRPRRPRSAPRARRRSVDNDNQRASSTREAETRQALRKEEQTTSGIVGVVGAIAAISLAATACSNATVFPSFSTSISSIRPTSNSEANVDVDIKNTSSTSGTAHCSVELYSPGHACSGFRYFELDNAVNGGAKARQTLNVTVYRDGAHQVTENDSTVRCY